MNVLFLTSEFLPPWGGIGVYSAEISKNMTGCEIYVVTPKRSGFNFRALATSDLQEILPQNIHIHYLGVAKDSFIYNFNFQINCLKNLSSLLKKYKIDIIHSQSTMPDIFISPPKVGVPIVTTIHTTIEGQLNAIKSSQAKFHELEFSEKMTLLTGPILKLVEKRYYNKNRYYITVSNWAKNQIIKQKKIDAENIAVIHNGVDLDKFHPNKKKIAEKYFPKLSKLHCPKILYLSRLIERKGVRFLLQAIPKIVEKVDVHFVFAGAGKNVTLNVPKNYTFIGYIPHEMAPYIYSLCDIFILPSLYENFPLSILEAMSSELAVIATDVGGIPEMIKHNENGILIPPKSSEDIADAVIGLAEDDSLRKKLGLRARKTVGEKFSWKTAALKTREYYERILNNENPTC